MSGKTLVPRYPPLSNRKKPRFAFGVCLLASDLARSAMPGTEAVDRCSTLTQLQDTVLRLGCAVPGTDLAVLPTHRCAKSFTDFVDPLT
eukprot:546193-Rhodomonas_salina.1